MLSGDLQDTALHEMMHRMEDLRPAIKAAEKSFYDRRTAGEASQPLSSLYPGSGYRRDEIARKDAFDKAYSGKDYGGRYYEVVSMGVEDLFQSKRPPSWITHDQDYMDFILGVLAVL
jgi:hypothetical protein